MTDLNKPERRYWFLTPAMVEAWERSARRTVKSRIIGLLVAFAVLAAFAPLLNRVIPPDRAPTPAPSPPATPAQNSDALFNDLLQNMIKMRSQYEAKEATFVNQVDKLYSASSFANKHEAARVIKVVTDLDELDRQYAEAVHQLPNKALAAANKAGFDTSERINLTLGLEMKLESFFKALDAFQAAEDEWARNTVELYQFAAKHADTIAAVHGQVTFTDGRLKTQFDAQLSKCRSSVSKMDAANQKLRAVQQEESKKYGVTQASQAK